MNRQLTATTAATLLLVAGPGLADDFEYTAELSGAQEVVVTENDEFQPGGVDTQATGQAHADFDPALTRVEVDFSVENLSGTFAAAHFHCGRPGENGPVVFGLVEPGPLSFDGSNISGELTNDDYTGADCEAVVGRPVNNIASLAFAMRDGLIFANVHTEPFPDGEVRGQMHTRVGPPDDDGVGNGNDDDDGGGNGNDDDNRGSQGPDVGY